MRYPGDVTGADTVLAWQPATLFSVNFSRGYPRYNPGEFSAQEMLNAAKWMPACSWVAKEWCFSERWCAFARLPTIVFDYPTVESSIVPTIRFTTAVYGVHRPGTAYRMDGVPIPLQAFLPMLTQVTVKDAMD